MAEQEMLVMLISAASLGLIHTILGPDHYLPFVMMGKAGNWSLLKTCLVTTVCGIGHVLGSLIIGLIGIGVGLGLHSVDLIDTLRGSIAAWMFIAFGLTYFAWGLKNALRNKSHKHFHIHSGRITHDQLHHTAGDHIQTHGYGLPAPVKNEDNVSRRRKQKRNVGIWALFVIFILGPCEPLIPLLMYPAAKLSFGGVLAVSATFTLFTVGTMVVLVILGYAGAKSIRWGFAEKYMHAIAGFTILLCGVGIAFLGL